MEIADYLKVARRRLWVLVLVPVLAGGAALAYGLLSPRTYSATATVLTPSLVGTQYSQFNGPQANSQFVSAFAASAADPTVVAQTAEETGVSVAELTTNVDVAQVGASSNMQLTYRGDDATGPAKVAHTLATNALTNIYTAQGKIAALQTDAAKKALDTANKAVNDYVVEAGVGEPTAAYQAAINQVVWLQQAQANYRALGEIASANSLRGPIASAQKQARAIGATLPQYNILLSSQTVANATYQSVLGDQRKVLAQASAAADPGVIQTSDVTPNVTPSSIAKLVIPVFGAGVLFAIILVALFEFIVAVRRQPSAHAALHAQPSGDQALHAQATGDEGLHALPADEVVAAQPSGRPEPGQPDEREPNQQREPKPRDPRSPREPKPPRAATMVDVV